MLTVRSFKKYHFNQEVDMVKQQTNNKQATNKQQQLESEENTKRKKNDKVERLIDEYEKLSGHSIRARSTRRKKILTLLKTFNANEVYVGWVSMAGDQWLRGENDRGTDFFSIEYAVRPDRVEHWLNKFKAENPDSELVRGLDKKK